MTGCVMESSKVHATAANRRQQLTPRTRTSLLSVGVVHDYQVAKIGLLDAGVQICKGGQRAVTLPAARPIGRASAPRPPRHRHRIQTAGDLSGSS